MRARRSWIPLWSPAKVEAVKRSSRIFSAWLMFISECGGVDMTWFFLVLCAGLFVWEESDGLAMNLCPVNLSVSRWKRADPADGLCRVISAAFEKRGGIKRFVIQSFITNIMSLKNAVLKKRVATYRGIIGQYWSPIRQVLILLSKNCRSGRWKEGRWSREKGTTKLSRISGGPRATSVEKKTGFLRVCLRSGWKKRS